MHDERAIVAGSANRQKIALRVKDEWAEIATFLGPHHYALVAPVCKRFKLFYTKAYPTSCTTSFKHCAASASSAAYAHDLRADICKVCKHAVAGGCLGPLQFAVQQTGNAHHCAWWTWEASRAGHLNVLEWIYGILGAFQFDTCWAQVLQQAGRNGHKHILVWAAACGAPPRDWRDMYKVVDLDLVVWALRSGCPGPTHVLRGPADKLIHRVDRALSRLHILKV